MTSRQTFVRGALLALLAATLYGVVRTQGSPKSPRGAAADSLGVDQSSLITAQELVRLPLGADEVAHAQDAFRIADQEMDLAFADAVRDAADKPRASTPEIRAITTRLQQAQRELAADQAAVVSLTAAVAKASPTSIDQLSDELNLEKAHVALHQDEVDDAHDDLITAGGDPQGRMQEMLDEHDASSRRSDSTRIAASAPPDGHGLVRRAQAWSDLREKKAALHQAQTAAEKAAATFATRHAALEAKSGRGDDEHSEEPASSMTHEASTALLRTTELRANDNRTLSSLDRHVDNQHRLAGVYAAWAGVVDDMQRTVVNRALRGLSVILVILVIGLLLDKWIEHVLGTMSMDRRRLQTSVMVFRVSIQVIGALLILLVILGPPNNLGTFLGLAGAGLTVALKDFILGFLGWFVLMGADGIRIGDMVEINDVTGEVVELGVLHTVLLETGSWSDEGHPTGRRVTFTNSFAIEGHYFNFSTTGRWLWDEIRVVVPNGRDPYPIAETLTAQVEEVTAESARAAEEHWKGARRSPQFTALTAAPAAHIKPVIGGVEITIRYITHVSERTAVRTGLYRTAVDLLGAGVATVPPLARGAGPVSSGV